MKLLTLGLLAGVAFLGGGALPGGLHDGDRYGIVQSPHAPRLPGPSYPEVVDRLLAGEPAAALARLDATLEPGDPPERPVAAVILRARLLDALARHADSEREWGEVARRTPALATLARREIVDNLVQRGQPAEATRHLERLTGSRHLDLVLAVADTHRRGGDDAAAMTLYRRVLSVQSRGASADMARLGIAATFEAAGDPAGAYATYRDALLQHRTPDTFSAAWAGEIRTAGLLERSAEPLREDDYLTLARRLRAASRYDETLQVLERWRHDHPASQRGERIDAELIDTLYGQRDNAEALSRCLAFLDRYPRGSLAADVRLTQFRLAVRVGRTDDVRAWGQALWSGRVPGATSSIRWSAGILLAAYLVSVGEVEDGLDVYRELFGRAGSRNRRLDVLWRAGVAAFRAGQYDRAKVNLEGALGRRPGGAMGPSARYWLAATRARLGDRDEALRAMVTLEQRQPFAYYGIRAAEWLVREAKPDESARIADLRRSARPASLAFPALRLSDQARGHANVVAATQLARAGLKAEAAVHARRALAGRRNDRALALLAIRASADAGAYRQALALLASHFGAFLQRPAADVPDDLWALAYPRPFWSEIAQAAGAQGVDPDLLVSLMRQESRFDPAARSPVGAIGLFQIMPYKAAELAPAIGRPVPDETELMRPEVNASLAARLLHDLTIEFGGALPPIIASYNAGEDRVQAWWQAAQHVSEELFIDTIPYSETRGFARAVWTNYHTYRRLGVQDR